MPSLSQLLSGYAGNFNPGSSVSIASGQTTSAAFQLGGMVLCGIQLPAAFTGATISFQVSLDGVTYQPLYVTTSGTLLSYTVTQGHFVSINSADFQGANYIKIVSASSEGAARTLPLSVRGLY